MLEVKELTCGYDEKFFLKEISFNVGFKEIIGIIGPNGSGKTTLLKAITRILKPKNGKVLFKEKDIWQIRINELAKNIAMVSQNPSGNFMTVEEFVLLGRIPHLGRLQFLENKHDLEIAQRAMSLTNTLKFKDQYLEEISGGERQLVFIARALAQQPELLLLDEPTTHLDISHQVAILDLIKRLNKEFGLTVIMVLHDLNLASEYCHRLILINEGRIYKIGSPEEILDYRIMEEVYKTIVVVEKNPISSKPYVLIVPEEQRKEERQRQANKAEKRINLE